MEVDRFFFCLSFLCVAYAAETTLDLTSTMPTTNLQADTDVTERLIETTIISDKKNVPTTDIPLNNEIEIEERATSPGIRTTEETLQVKELPTTKLESTTAEAKEVLENDATTIATAPPPVHVTERSSQTTKSNDMEEKTSTSQKLKQDTTTPPPVREAIVTSTQSTASKRPTKSTQKKHKTRQKPTTTTIKPLEQAVKTEEVLQQHPAGSNIVQQVTSKPISRPNRKSTVEAKKGTINAGSLHTKRRRKPSKKDNGMSSLVYIPLMIQAQMIPMMLMQLKFFALKALAIGKLALLILGLNLLRNAIIGYHNDEQQYEQESLASAHYGYNGGPEYGSWVNKRMLQVDPEFRSPKLSPEMEPRINYGNGYDNNKSRLNRSQNRFSNNPYRGYKNEMLIQTR